MKGKQNLRADDSQAGRRTRARLKELLLQAAQEVLERDGLGFNTHTVTYKSVFEHLEQSQGIRVTRGSVHERIWASQREFQFEVLQRAVNWAPERSNEALLAAATGVLENADRSTEAGRWNASRDLVREAAREVYLRSDADDHWPQWIGLTLALTSQRDSEQPEARLLVEGARSSYRARGQELAELYRGFMNAAKMQVRPDRFPDPDEALRTMARLLTAFADGLALREQFDPDVAADVPLRASDGSADPWHPFSLAAWAVVQFFLEPRPD